MGGDERGGEGGERRGVEAFLVMWPRRLSALNPPLLTVMSVDYSAVSVRPAVRTAVLGKLVMVSCQKSVTELSPPL